VVDTQGFVRKVVVSASAVQDRDGARLLPHTLRLYGPDLPRLALVWADAGYSGQMADDLRQLMGWMLEVVKWPDTQPRATFALQPHRGIVERTFGWRGGLRRLTKDSEYQVESSKAPIYLGMSHLMLRRLTRARARTRALGACSSPAG
jgi:putative transposase